MINNHLFNFKTDISSIIIPESINNPFSPSIPEIAKIAAKELQDFITSESKNWEHDFVINKGKMFGILVVQKKDNTYSFIGTNSGKLPHTIKCNRFIPSVFDDSVDDFFINKGMAELTSMGIEITQAKNTTEINILKERRKKKSSDLQQQLFENYVFLNVLGEKKNVIQIFNESSHGNPPSASGECSAPKLLHYAFKHSLKPIALAEFWWGNSLKNKERKHMNFYPSCKNKCRPILELSLIHI